MRKQITLGLLLVFCLSNGFGQSIQDYLLASKARRENNHKEALVYYTKLTETSEYNGDHWFKRGSEQVWLDKYEAAIHSFAKAIEYKSNLKFSHYLTGLSYAQLGEQDKALVHFEKLIELDPSWIQTINTRKSLSGFRDSSAGQKWSPKRDSALVGRNAQWEADLDFLYQTLVKSHYNAYVKNGPEVWNEHYEKLKAIIPELSDHELYLEFMKLTALAGDGHTNIWPISNGNFKFKMLPASIYPFEDGFYVKYAPEQYQSIVGWKVKRIGGLEVETIFKKINEFEGHENLMHRKLLSNVLMVSLDILKMLGANGDQTQMVIEVEKNGKSAEASLKPVPMDYNSLSSNHTNTAHWSAMNENSETTLPLWLKHPDKAYWRQRLSDSATIYFQYNNVLENEEHPFKEFCKSLFESIESGQTKNLIIDIRMNDGGSTPLYSPLLKGLMAHQGQLDNLFLIIGRRTYSAAMNLATDLEYWTDAILVGEPTGSSPNFIGENKIFHLPYSGIRVSVSDRYHQRGASSSLDKRVWIAPDVYVGLKSSDFANNVDPIMETITRYLSKADD
ncbi:MAG: tetratricopeptide repeat protein [Roseivirga sp.]|nr:tetratricopeptide repeat protein [Roseivirga sp.]